MDEAVVDVALLVPVSAKPRESLLVYERFQSPRGDKGAPRGKVDAPTEFAFVGMGVMLDGASTLDTRMTRVVKLMPCRVCYVLRKQNSPCLSSQ